MLAVSIFLLAKKTTCPHKQSSTNRSPPRLSHFWTHSPEFGLRNTFAVNTIVARSVTRVQNSSLYNIGSGDDHNMADPCLGYSRLRFCLWNSSQAANQTVPSTRLGLLSRCHREWIEKHEATIVVRTSYRRRRSLLCLRFAAQLRASLHRWRDQQENAWYYRCRPCGLYNIEMITHAGWSHLR